MAAATEAALECLSNHAGVDPDDLMVEEISRFLSSFISSKTSVAEVKQHILDARNTFMQCYPNLLLNLHAVFQTIAVYTAPVVPSSRVVGAQLAYLRVYLANVVPWEQLLWGEPMDDDVVYDLLARGIEEVGDDYKRLYAAPSTEMGARIDAYLLTQTEDINTFLREFGSRPTLVAVVAQKLRAYARDRGVIGGRGLWSNIAWTQSPANRVALHELLDIWDRETIRMLFTRVIVLRGAMDRGTTFNELYNGLPTDDDRAVYAMATVLAPRQAAFGWVDNKDVLNGSILPGIVDQDPDLTGAPLKKQHPMKF